MKRISLLSVFAGLLFVGCSSNNDKADAYGSFEVDEITVSSKTAGELLVFNVDEGIQLSADSAIGIVDTTDMNLQRAEIAAALQSASARRVSNQAQIKVAQRELEQIERDNKRTSAMFEQKAATQKQMEDVNTALDLSRRKLEVLNSQFSSIDAEVENIKAKSALLEQRIQDAIIKNPVNGTVLTTFVHEHELLAPGRPLYTIADMSYLHVKAFVSGDQLSQIKLGQTVDVGIDVADKQMRQHKGTITWISSKAEFTPKTVQTKDERVALVYAIKVRVRNDGNLHIGMPAEVRWSKQ